MAGEFDYISNVKYNLRVCFRHQRKDDENIIFSSWNENETRRGLYSVLIMSSVKPNKYLVTRDNNCTLSLE